MRSAAIVLALVSSGCFASWVTTQATGTERAWDEGVRAQAVARIAERHADALDALAALPQGAVRDELTRFADELAVRDA